MVVYTRIHLVIVSIHTPTQGVTFLYICNVFRICFNPHTHAGCDRSGRFTLCCSMDVSIHTPTQGVTTLAAVNSRNPRVSIHTPTQGVTQAEVWKVWHRSFNPHTHAGCDNRSSRPSPVLRVSIHTPTQGVTPLWRYAL